MCTSSKVFSTNISITILSIFMSQSLLWADQLSEKRKVVAIRGTSAIEGVPSNGKGNGGSGGGAGIVRHLVATGRLISTEVISCPLQD